MTSFPEEVVPLVQTDDFSCGYLALAAIYQSYGIEPERALLRERLGTSVPAIPFLADSTGTLQPDLIRVLRQDGFEVEALHPIEQRGDLIKHLLGPHLVLALVKTEKAGGLHWIVLSDYQDGSFQVADSLVAGLQWQPAEELLGPRFLQALLLSPGTPDPESPLFQAHYAGSLMLLASLSPLQQLVLVLSVAVVVALLFVVLRFLYKKWVSRRNRSAAKPC